jgi:hypothetical protein
MMNENQNTSESANEYEKLLQEIGIVACSIAGIPVPEPFYSDFVLSHFDGLPGVQDEEVNGHPGKWKYFIYDPHQGVGESSGFVDSRQQCIQSLAEMVAEKLMRTDENITDKPFQIVPILESKPQPHSISDLFDL